MHSSSSQRCTIELLSRPKVREWRRTARTEAFGGDKVMKRGYCFPAPRYAAALPCPAHSASGAFGLTSSYLWPGQRQRCISNIRKQNIMERRLPAAPTSAGVAAE